MVKYYLTALWHFTGGLVKCRDSDSIIPQAPPLEPPHHLQLALRDPYHNGFLHENAPDSLSPLGRESGSETQDYPTVITVRAYQNTILEGYLVTVMVH